MLMSRLACAFAAFFAVLSIHFAFSDDALAQAGSDWHSQWTTTVGDMYVRELPNGRYEGVYGGGANFSGSMQPDGTFLGFWYAGSGARACPTVQGGTRYWGRMRWVFNQQARTFRGTFGFCDNINEGAWNGQMVWSRASGRVR